MKREFPVRLALTATVLLLSAALIPATAETIDFEDETPGTIVSVVFGDGGGGPVNVMGINPFCPSLNAAVIFDSTAPTGGDIDLGSPNETCDPPGPGIGVGGEVGMPYENCAPRGNILIVHERCADLGGASVADPDDADIVGSELHLDFTAIAPVTIESIVLFDVEAIEPNATVELFDQFDGSIAFFNLPQTGDNGVAEVGLGPTPGVWRMAITLNGSGAIDNVVFNRGPFCGDGEINLPGETCDPPGEPAGEPNVCRDDCTFCGDGILDAGEECDDGNNLDGDGCSAYCEIEQMGDGCTPGYWKNHPESWPPTGLAPGDDFVATFGCDVGFSGTLWDAVNANGGGVRKVARHGTAALLNARHPAVNYPASEAEIIAMVCAGDADLLAEYNELSDTCPAEFWSE